MYAIIVINDKQYKVKENSILTVKHALPFQKGEEFYIKKVLFIFNEDSSIISFDKNKNISKGGVLVKLINQKKDKKIKVIKFKRRKKYLRTIGHRNNISVIKILKINY